MKKILAVLISLIFVGSTFGIASVLGKTGGPDAFGYTYDDTVPYQWIDISGTGKNTGLDMDDGGITVPIGFNFNYYGTNYNEVYISTNGLLKFSGADTTWSNKDIPLASDPNNIICVFWDDLRPPDGDIYYQSFSDKFIVQWNDIPHISDNSLPPSRSSLTFQIILYRNSNAIKFQYKEMKNDNCYFADGRSATIGIENIHGTDGLKYFYGDVYGCTETPAGPIKDGLAIGFKYPGRKAPWETGQLPMAQILKILKANKDKE